MLHEKANVEGFFKFFFCPDLPVLIVFLSPGRLSDVSAKPWRSVYMQQ